MKVDNSIAVYAFNNCIHCNARIMSKMIDQDDWSNNDQDDWSNL